MTSSTLVLVLTTLLAATVNGSLGYGLSSITAPVALLFYANRILNPALVWVEVVLNTYVLWANRASVPAVWRRVLPMILGLAPDRKSTRLNSSHGYISYAVFCLKKKKKPRQHK